MSAFVLTATRPGTSVEALDAYAYGTVQARLTLSGEFVGGSIHVWQTTDFLAAEVQADRLASGMYVALPFRTLAEVQERATEWRNF